MQLIDSYVPMKKQGKRSTKKHLSKEAFRKIIYKQNMWKVYKGTGKDNDYDAYKEALKAATNEGRKSERNFEYKLALNIEFLCVCGSFQIFGAIRCPRYSLTIIWLKIKHFEKQMTIYGTP